MNISEKTISFFINNFPSMKTILIAGPPGIAWAFICLFFAGYLKKNKGLRTGYTRKTFHFLIFMTVALIHSVWGTPGVCLFGGMTTIVIFFAVYKGDGNILYEAMAREKDEPHRSYFIIAPYFATLIGGLASNILFDRLAVIGYLATGLGDAVGEPVGTRFGKHPYAVPSLRGVKSTRTYEGSAAVFLVCIIAIVTGIIISPQLHMTTQSLYMIPLLAAACMITEGISPHGWDNATMQIVPSLLAVFMLE
ncbi:MAG: hypothetical protein GY749_32715 [Desulfobacteraceae bacterium]|nr:hypothetical protein [Desulfobacteraceae bacterium]